VEWELGVNGAGGNLDNYEVTIGVTTGMRRFLLVLMRSCAVSSEPHPTQ